jgi:hypothetical protein
MACAAGHDARERHPFGLCSSVARRRDVSETKPLLEESVLNQGSIRSFIENYWWATLFAVILLVWAWRAWRRSTRPSPPAFEIPSRDTRDIRSTSPFRRSDFAAKAETVRREMVKGFGIAMAIFLVGFPALLAVSWLAPTLLQESFGPVAVVLCAAGVASMLVFAIRGSRMMRRIGLVCPACGTELVGTIGVAGAWIQDRVFETGKCPRCGAQLLDPTEVGPESRTFTRADHARALGLIAALLAALGAITYFGNASMAARRSASCNRRYAAAHNPVDSGAVDVKPLNERGTVTCGDLRRAGRLADGPQPQ